LIANDFKLHDALFVYCQDEEYAWIGARYNASAGEHRWIDGSEMKIDGWAPGQPQHPGCIDYLGAKNWLWNSHEDCHNTHCSFICEKKAC
jgi:hypothetical protein